jgi:hypothetical protein
VPGLRELTRPLRPGVDQLANEGIRAYYDAIWGVRTVGLRSIEYQFAPDTAASSTLGTSTVSG